MHLNYRPSFRGKKIGIEVLFSHLLVKLSQPINALFPPSLATAQATLAGAPPAFFVNSRARDKLLPCFSATKSMSTSPIQNTSFMKLNLSNSQINENLGVRPKKELLFIPLILSVSLNHLLIKDTWSVLNNCWLFPELKI